MRFGMPVPERIANAPELELGLGLYYNGFLDLTSCRQIGMALGPISFLAISEYCTAKGLSQDQREDFLWLMPKLDAKYLEWSRTKTPVNRPSATDPASAAPQKPTPPPRRPSRARPRR